MIGWLADKNHATIIHAVKTVNDLLEIRDPMTLTAMEAWSIVFKKELGKHSDLKYHFSKGLSALIMESGLTDEVVEKLLITELEKLQESKQSGVSL